MGCECACVVCATLHTLWVAGSWYGEGDSQGTLSGLAPSGLWLALWLVENVQGPIIGLTHARTG